MMETWSYVGDGGGGGTSAEDNETILDYSADPVHPLEFPNPTISDGKVVSLSINDHLGERGEKIERVLMRSERDWNDYPVYAYSLEKEIHSKSRRYGKKTFVGNVLKCEAVVGNDSSSESLGLKSVERFAWRSTNELVVIQVVSIRKNRKRGVQRVMGLLREVAAMQLIGNYHLHVLGCLDVLQDDYNLFTISPFVIGGNLRQMFVKSRVHLPREETVRGMFAQLLLGLQHLQQKGVCHQNLSLESILFDERSSRLIISDVSMSSRVPYDDPSNTGGITDVSEGYKRRRICVEDRNGYVPLMYQPPEVLESDGFDGFAADIWSAGVILFVMLVGKAPFKEARSRDEGYAKIRSGRLKHVVRKSGVLLSREACDLLQNMFWPNPEDRLTLKEIMRHKWVQKSASSSYCTYAEEAGIC